VRAQEVTAGGTRPDARAAELSGLALAVVAAARWAAVRGAAGWVAAAVG
jgi:hypothetical protein